MSEYQRQIIKTINDRVMEYQSRITSLLSTMQLIREMNEETLEGFIFGNEDQWEANVRQLVAGSKNVKREKTPGELVIFEENLLNHSPIEHDIVSSAASTSASSNDIEAAASASINTTGDDEVPGFIALHSSQDQETAESMPLIDCVVPSSITSSIYSGKSDPIIEISDLLQKGQNSLLTDNLDGKKLSRGLVLPESDDRLKDRRIVMEMKTYFVGQDPVLHWIDLTKTKNLNRITEENLLFGDVILYTVAEDSEGLIEQFSKDRDKKYFYHTKHKTGTRREKIALNTVVASETLLRIEDMPYIEKSNHGRELGSILKSWVYIDIVDGKVVIEFDSFC